MLENNEKLWDFFFKMLLMGLKEEYCCVKRLLFGHRSRLLYSYHFNERAMQLWNEDSTSPAFSSFFPYPYIGVVEFLPPKIHRHRDKTRKLKLSQWIRDWKYQTSGSNCGHCMHTDLSKYKTAIQSCQPLSYLFFL